MVNGPGTVNVGLVVSIAVMICVFEVTLLQASVNVQVLVMIC